MGNLELRPLRLTKLPIGTHAAPVVRVASEVTVPGARAFRRRAALGWLASTGTGLLVPSAAFSPTILTGCDVATEILEQVLAEIVEYLVGKLKYLLDEAIDGTIDLLNHEATDQTGVVAMALEDSSGTTRDTKDTNVVVPAGTKATYMWKAKFATGGGGQFIARATSKFNEASTQQFNVG